MYFQEQELQFLKDEFSHLLKESKNQALNLFPEEKKTETSLERKTILTWTSGVPMSACFGFKDKVAKGLSKVQKDARITGAGNPETTGPFSIALLLSSVTCSLPPTLPEPQRPGLFHGETVCLYPLELFQGPNKSIHPIEI